MTVKELCVENCTQLLKPENLQQIDRIELCDNLAEGGTTVSIGVAEMAIQLCQPANVQVMGIIRPRGGNFIYSAKEVEMMLIDIHWFKQLGMDGVVIGCLDQQHWIDEGAVQRLLEAAKGMLVTFHMAFDEIPEERRFEAIDWLVDAGVDRILTHGGLGNQGIEAGLSQIQKYVAYAGKRIVILPGGGITFENFEEIVEQTGVKEVHGTRVVELARA